MFKVWWFSMPCISQASGVENDANQDKAIKV